MRTTVFAVCALLLVALAGLADAQGGWKQPPKQVVDILDAPPTPRMVMSPMGTRALLVTYDPYPPLEMLARPFLRLAGIRIDPALNARQRTMRNRAIEILDIEKGTRVALALPADASINSVRWAPDGRRFAFTNDLKDGVELWIGDAEKGTAAPYPELRVNDVLGAPFDWNGDGCKMIARAVPKGRAAPPKASPVPDGPVVEETAGKTSKMMTYQDLLKNPHDEDLFQYYGTSQLWFIHLNCAKDYHGRPDDGPLGKPGLYASIEMRPMPDHLLVTTLQRPFSYRVPSGQFAQKVEIWSAPRGEVEKLVADIPIADEIPPQGVRTGPRSFEWRPDSVTEPATLVWVEALDGGDPLKKVPFRDRVMTLAAPFAEPREVMKIKNRFSGLMWLPSESARHEALVADFDRDRRWSTISLVDFDAPAEPKVLFDRSVNDAYSDPGMPIQEIYFGLGQALVREDDSIFLAGNGASEAGDRPFLDRFDLKTMKKERLWQSAENAYETFTHFANQVTIEELPTGKERPGMRATKERRIVIRSESKTEPPNWFLVDLKSGERKRITDFKDPAPELTKVKKELLKYKRADGCQLTGTLYLPPDYQEGTKLPLLVWAYPLEYSDAGTAGQVRGSTKTFTRLAGDSPLWFLLNGYAVLMDATMPVIGDPEKMNDTFVEQIVSSAQAAVDAVAAKGVADPDRCCVSGHSYGAFMTANLLAHSDIFAAGIARSGAYNRTLTPFGFQSERRSYWEATDLYTKMSPFTYANKINEPLLMIHGDADNNPGTHTVQSERLFQAIRGNGGTARLVLLPYEAHGYRARENVLQVIAEMFEWADKYVKNRKVPQR